MTTERPRLVDVAALAGVSQKTVSNVLNDHPHVTLATRNKVEAALQELDYRVNLSARSLASGRTGFIAFALSTLANPYFAQLAGHVIRAAAAERWTVLIEETGGSQDSEAKIVSGTMPYLVDGIVMHPESAGHVHAFGRRDHTPLVLIGERILDNDADHVAADAVRAAYDLTRHLLTRGRRRIAVVGLEKDTEFTTSALRYQGYEDALREAGIEVDPQTVIPIDDYNRRDGALAAESLLALGERPDAVICFNDLTAIGLLSALQRAGVSVPGEMAVAGFDDIDDAAYANPPLTTVAWNTKALAEEAVALLADRQNDRDRAGRKVAVDYQLVVRDST